MPTFQELAIRRSQEAAQQEASEKRATLQREFQRTKGWWQDQVLRAFGKEWVDKIQWVEYAPSYILLEGICWKRVNYGCLFLRQYGLEAMPAYIDCRGVHLPWGDFDKVSSMSWAEAGRILQKPKETCPICTLFIVHDYSDSLL